MDGIWWELKVRLEGEEYERLKAAAERAGKDVGEFACGILRRFLEASNSLPEVHPT